MVPQRIEDTHLWVGRCGCYSDIKMPSWKPWSIKPQWHWFGWSTLLPVTFGGDEYCRTTLVLGYTITGRIVIPLWSHSEASCGECPMETSEGTSCLDEYLGLSKETRDEK